MKTIVGLVVGMVLTGCGFIYAQTGGLEGIIVEKYYVSTSSDTVASDSSGYLAPGSVTYRIYADLKPVYRLQAVFGIENHELRISTSTRFYNCRFSDGRSANDIQPANLLFGTAMLDSWVSVGAGALDYQAVMKSEDDTSGNLAVQNSGMLFRNTGNDVGIPLTERDGMRFLRYQPATQFYNFDADLHVFEYAWRDSVSGLLRTSNGAWASYGGTVGPQPENRVLIAQLTTDGVLEFELNIQVATPDGKVEKYVARNPGNDEIYLPSLTYSSAPDVKISPVMLACSQDINRVEPEQILKFHADAGSKSIQMMEFYLDGNPVSAVQKKPFEFQFKSDGKAHSLFVKSIDKNGVRTCSNTLVIKPVVTAD